MFDHLYSKQEALDISEAMNTPYDQRSDKQSKILIHPMANELNLLWQKYDQIFKQLEK